MDQGPGTLLLFSRSMRDKDTSALREVFQHSSLVKKPLDQCEIATHGRTFQIQHKSRHGLVKPTYSGENCWCWCPWNGWDFDSNSSLSGWPGPLVVTHPSLELQLLIYYNQQPLFFDQLCSRSWYFDLGFDVDCVFCSTQVTKAISKRNNQREQRHKRLLCPGMSKSTVQCFTADKDLKCCKYINIHVLPWSIRGYCGSALRRKLGFCFNTSVFSVQCCNNAQERSETKGRLKLDVHFHRG